MALTMTSTYFTAGRNCHLPIQPPDAKRRRPDYLHEETTIPVAPPGPVAHATPRWSTLDVPCDDEFMTARAHAVHASWRQAESNIPIESWLISFEEGSEFENLRLSAVDFVFNYIQTGGYSQSTLHLAVQYVNRFFHHHWMHLSGKESFYRSILAASVLAATRAAVKMHENYDLYEQFRREPGHMWQSADALCGSQHVDKSLKSLNQMERMHLKILEKDGHSPVASDFLDQYLGVGGWPSSFEYRELALFLLALSLFSTGRHNPLRGTPPSKIAAAALILAVKIVNNDGPENSRFEFWTARLQTFTQYKTKELQPVVQSLSKLLRRRQQRVKCDAFSTMFPKWAQYDWT